MANDTGKNPNLKYFNLSHNALISLPCDIGKLTNLIELDLRDNNLEYLPNSVRELTELKILYLNTNNFSIFPSCILELANLTELNLRENYITTLPANIARLSKLNCFFLSDNLLNCLCESIGSLTNLKVLDLDSNNLTCLPKNLEKCTSLNDLDLCNNPWSLKGLLNFYTMNMKPETLDLDPLFSQTLNQIQDNDFCSIVKQILNEYADISLEEFIDFFLTLNTDQIKGMVVFQLPLPELGIGIDLTNKRLSAAIELVDTPFLLNQLLDKVQGIKKVSQMNSIQALELVKTKPTYLQGILDFGLREDQMVDMDLKEIRISSFEIIANKIQEKNYRNSTTEMIIGELTEADKELARTTYDTYIKPYFSQQGIKKNYLQQIITHNSDSTTAASSSPNTSKIAAYDMEAMGKALNMRAVKKTGPETKKRFSTSKAQVLNPP